MIYLIELYLIKPFLCLIVSKFSTFLKSIDYCWFALTKAMVHNLIDRRTNLFHLPINLQWKKYMIW